MGRKQRKELEEFYQKRISFLTDEIEEDYFEKDDNKQRLEDVIKDKKKIVKFVVGENSVLFLFRYNLNRESMLSNDLISVLIDNIKKDLKDNENRIYLIGIAESIHEKNTLISILREKKAHICKSVSRYAKDTSMDVIFVPKIDSKPIELNVTRMNSLLFPEPSLKLNVLESKEDNKEKEEIKGYLFVAKLSDIVDIYDRVGDDLFSCNLRYGIEDKLSLENSMKSTLLEEPNMFWFYNNGITIVTDNDNIGLENSSKIVLSNSWESRKISFSVINGAQTISTASRIFGDSTIEKKKIDHAKEDAKVLLRIIIAEKKSVKRKITISLNRQKPIKTEDISFQSAFVSAFNEYMELRDQANKEYLYIVKRGEEIYDSNAIELSVFAQLVYTCFMNPTDARNKGPAKLYYENKEEENLNDKYFKNSFFSETGKEREQVYNQYYQEIIWAFKLYKSYNEILKKEKDKDTRTILANNKWSFISYILKCMGYGSGDAEDVNYADFKGNADVIINLEKYMKEFVYIVNLAYKDHYNPENSKTKEFWENIIECEKTELFKSLTKVNASNNVGTKQMFGDILIKMGFQLLEDNNYEREVDCAGFSSLEISLNDDKKTFDISTTICNPYYAMENMDEKESDKQFAELVEQAKKELINQCGYEPDTDLSVGCDDTDVVISYTNVEYNKEFVEKFILAMCF